jgi:hypothetical protein
MIGYKYTFKSTAFIKFKRFFDANLRALADRSSMQVSFIQIWLHNITTFPNGIISQPLKTRKGHHMKSFIKKSQLVRADFFAFENYNKWRYFLTLQKPFL